MIATLAIASTMNAPKIPSNGGEALQIQLRNSSREVKMAIIGDFFPKPTDIQKSAIASITDDNTDYLDNDKFSKLFKTCFCESSLNEEAICYLGYKGGMGLCGFIPKTWNYVLGKIEKDTDLYVPDKCKVVFTELDMNHPIFDATCNWTFAQYLYKHEGKRHWNSSILCWNK